MEYPSKSSVSRDAKFSPPDQDHSSASLTPRPYRIHPYTPIIIGFFAGTFLGISHGSQIASLRFRAENAHRLPTTTTGWYLYHKSKNYHAMLGGATEGLKMGTKIAFWAAGFFTIENAIDHLSGKPSFLSTSAAGLSVAGAFSALNRFPLTTFARTAKLGLFGGTVLGLVQDCLNSVKGNRPFYVNTILRGRSVSETSDLIV